MREPGRLLCSCCREKEVNAFAFQFGRIPKDFKYTPPRCRACKTHGTPCADERKKEVS